MKRFLLAGSPRKKQNEDSSTKKLKSSHSQVLENSPDDLSDDDVKDKVEEKVDRVTDVESTLPPIAIDQNAIDEYESSQASVRENPSKTLQRLQNRNFFRCPRMTLRLSWTRTYE